MRFLALALLSVSLVSFGILTLAFAPASAFASTLASAAKTILHVPLFVEFTTGSQFSPNYDYVPVSEVNKTLIQKGVTPQLESVDLTIDTDFDAMTEQSKLDRALQSAGLTNAQGFGELVPGIYNRGSAVTCYRGKGEDVLEIVLRNVGGLYSDQFNLHAWRLGTKVVYSKSLKGSEDAEELLAQSKAWTTYDQKSDSVLILSSISDDGDDVQESLIPRCN